MRVTPPFDLLRTVSPSMLLRTVSPSNGRWAFFSSLLVFQFILLLFQSFFMPDTCKASPGTSDRSVGLDFAAEHCKPQSPDDTENESHDKVCLRADLPEKGAA